YPTVPFWENERFNESDWIKQIASSLSKSKEQGISIYVHLPFCESLCTYCGCNTRITKNHKVEDPYITSILKEWQMYKKIFNEEKLKIGEIHLGGCTPTFFTAGNLRSLVTCLLKWNEKSAVASFSFEA